MVSADLPKTLRATSILPTCATALAVLGAGIALYNRITLPRLADRPTTVIEPVTVCVPARNEADRLPDLIADLRAQVGVPRLTVRILDDASTDDTGAAARAAIGDDSRFTLLRTESGPLPGWTGKAAACVRLAEEATEPVLIFVDADVRLAPAAIAAAVGALRRRGAALVSPWPLQVAGSVAEAVVQPLLCWSWASTLPVAVSDRSLRPSTAVACGQFLVFDNAVYRAAGGHAAVAGSVTEDLDIARTLRRAGHSTVLVAAGPLAGTRMYRGAADLDAGYTRWLWSAYDGTIAGGAAVGLVAAFAYWVPPVAAVLGRGAVRWTGTIGWLAAVGGRLLARSTEIGGPLRAPDVLAAAAHPVSVAAYLLLWARSHRARRRGTARWKGRSLD
ncbi:glycosyltransferase [Nocardia abscessus]|uniref:Glycosyltransferase n=1 Tax=Nocardia abscessus TaxID=120957 RepID=A0ABS0CCU3_9NOCA|nr:glycosyltransferase [Nocardia abscessus]MBF6227696.1 glycosyltransferase [Nocardia abscessus]